MFAQNIKKTLELNSDGRIKISRLKVYGITQVSVEKVFRLELKKWENSACETGYSMHISALTREQI